MKLLAAVVTHNRRDLLTRCLDHISSQHRQADGLVVINNESTDGTVEMLLGRGVDFVTQPNLGSAGGWQRAIVYAQERGYDAVWLMDDDGFPDAGALMCLETHLKPGIACASSIVVREDEAGRFVFPFPIMNSLGFPVLLRWPRKLNFVEELSPLAKGGVYPFAHFFNGALIALDAVARIGNVNSSYFMYGDEVDYFCRLRTVGGVISVLDAVHYHPDVSRRALTPSKVYYYIKNSIIIHNLYFDMAFTRNIMAIAAIIVRITARNGFMSTLSYVAGRNVRVFYLAIAKGFTGKIGADFRG